MADAPDVREDELEHIMKQSLPLSFVSPSPLLPTELPSSAPTPTASNQSISAHSAPPSVPLLPVQTSAMSSSTIASLVRAGQPVRYFVMKCVSQGNLDVALQQHVWATQAHNESRLNEAYSMGEVVLVFSVNLSRHFQAYARMASRVGTKSAAVWHEQQQILGGLFRLQWLQVAALPFSLTEHLINPWNEFKPVKISRDGQELPADVGYQLCALLDHHAVAIAAPPPPAPPPGAMPARSDVPKREDHDGTAMATYALALAYGYGLPMAMSVPAAYTFNPGNAPVLRDSHSAGQSRGEDRIRIRSRSRTRSRSRFRSRSRSRSRSRRRSRSRSRRTSRSRSTSPPRRSRSRSRSRHSRSRERDHRRHTRSRRVSSRERTRVRSWSQDQLRRSPSRERSHRRH